MIERLLPGLEFQIKRAILLVTCCSLIFTIIGCDAFVRKFTRKHNKEEMPREELVLTPEEYKPTMNKEQQYRQYFLFWQSWQDELIEALAQKKSLKKQIDCAEQAIKNLLNLKELLSEAKQSKLDIYINQTKELKDLIARDIYTSGAGINIRTAESIKRAIFRDFSYNKIKKDISYGGVDKK